MLSHAAASGSLALRRVAQFPSYPLSLPRSALYSSSASSPATFALPKLSYAYDALEPHLDAQTMELHHKRHHQTYISNLNGLVTGPGSVELGGQPLADIQRKFGTLPASIRTPAINSGGGHYNHSLWWSTLRADAPSAPPAELRAKIDADFGELEEMKKLFEEAAAKRFGSGWAWLSLGEDGKLFVSSTANQENPLMDGVVDRPGTPILGTFLGTVQPASVVASKANTGGAC